MNSAYTELDLLRAYRADHPEDWYDVGFNDWIEAGGYVETEINDRVYYVREEDEER